MNSSIIYCTHVNNSNSQDIKESVSLNLSFTPKNPSP